MVRAEVYSENGESKRTYFRNSDGKIESAILNPSPDLSAMFSLNSKGMLSSVTVADNTGYYDYTDSLSRIQKADRYLALLGYKKNRNTATLVMDQYAELQKRCKNLRNIELPPKFIQ